MSNTQFSRLFAPLQVGPMRVPNRICATTHSIGFPFPSDAFTAFHVGKAKGGTGWIGGESWVLNSPIPPELQDEFSMVTAAMHTAPYQMAGFVDNVARFCGEVHKAGAVAVFQLSHFNNVFAASASPISPLYDAIPRELNEEMIDFLLNTYANAAALAKEAGGDGVEIHCAHESLLHSFLSPATNFRTDRWGGGPQERIRIVVEILERIRKRVGNSLAVGVRMNGQESRQGGYDHMQFREMSCVLGETGLLDFINIDVGHNCGAHAYIPPSFYGPAEHREIGKAAKADLGPNVAVMFAGRINEPVVAEDLLKGGYCDLVGMARAGIADPEFANKAREGRLIEIRRCIACNRCIEETIQGPLPANILSKPMCSVNPVVGNEMHWAENFRPADKPKRVVVVGGGAAGLEAARISALRGHKVILFEQGKRVGGQLLLASKTPGRDSFEDQVYFQENQLERLGVDVRLGTVADVNAIMALNPDAVVIATGSVPRYPHDTPGIDLPHVINGWDVVLKKVSTGARVAVVSQENHYETPSIALFLAEQGKQVEVFHSAACLGWQIERYSYGGVMQRIEQNNVRIHPNLRLTEITPDKIKFASSFGVMDHEFGGFASVVLVYGSVPNSSLYDKLKADKSVSQLYVIGSAWAPRFIAEATRDGANIGMAI